MNPRFPRGGGVRVHDRQVRGHVRTPLYVRGKRGIVERVCGAYRNPEDLAYGRRDGRPIPLYRVRFAAGEVWPDYAGSPLDTIDVEIYEHWLDADDAR